jgi:acyl-coenzyme A thioesterase PaaI-like protein
VTGDGLDRDRSPKPLGQLMNVRDDHHCFGCGRQNPHGLQLTFYLDDNGDLWAPWTPDQRHEGYTGIAHGGVIAAVLDEVMAWTVYSRQIWAVTGKMNITYRKPVEMGVPARALGRIVTDRGRVLELAAELRRDEGNLVLAEATATFIRVPEQQATAWRERYLER